MGWELNSSLAILGTVVPLDRNDMDLSKPESIGPIIQEIKPDIIVNAAAYTAVDKAESEPELAMTINGVAPGVIAEEAKKANASMIHYSTDYVFDGNATTPYNEEDLVQPLSVYGKSKLAGEKAVSQASIPYIILRTSWVYSLRGSNFLLTMQKLAQTKDQINVVDDQTGSPTWSRAIARGTTQILKHCLNNKDPKSHFVSNSGIFHMSCGGQTNWFGFASKILELSGLSNNTKLFPIPTTEYPTPAERPRYSLLSNNKLMQVFHCEMPHWQDALKKCLGSDTT